MRHASKQAAFDERLRRGLTEFSPTGIVQNVAPVEAVLATTP
ncbi:hypothetical protein ACFXGT_29355 [Streptomyces sp. NPDC059352]